MRILVTSQRSRWVSGRGSSGGGGTLPPPGEEADGAEGETDRGGRPQSQGGRHPVKGGGAPPRARGQAEGRRTYGHPEEAQGAVEASDRARPGRVRRAGDGGVGRLQGGSPPHPREEEGDQPPGEAVTGGDEAQGQ